MVEMGVCEHDSPLHSDNVCHLVPLQRHRQPTTVFTLASKRLNTPHGKRWRGGSLGRERRTQDSMTRGSNPVRSTTNIYESFSNQKCCADSLSVCICTQKNEHVSTLKIMLSMPEFGGLRKREQIQHALRSGRLASACLLFPLYGRRIGGHLHGGYVVKVQSVPSCSKGDKRCHSEPTCYFRIISAQRTSFLLENASVTSR